MSSLLIALVLAAAVPESVASAESVEDRCFIENLCSLKEAVRWKTPAWTEGMCKKVGRALIREAAENGIPRYLLLSVMINESDMNEKAARLTLKAGRLVAWDGGLMGVRCKVGPDGKSCTNYKGRFKYRDLLKVETSIKLGAKKLAAVREDKCKHKDHPWFAHYNWGSKIFRTGVARSYPQRVAVLWKALTDAQGVQQPELAGLRFVQIAGKRPVTIATPVGQRHKELVSKIWSSTNRACKEPQVASGHGPEALATR